MTDAELIKATKEAYRIAQTMPIYGAPEKDKDRVAKAVRSSMRTGAASSRWMVLAAQCRERNLNYRD